MKYQPGKYIYPKFESFVDIGIRIGGFGLANCMFVYARALVLAELFEYKLINPTWQRFGIGQYIRNEKDKRHYFGIFKSDGITGLKKYLLILFGEKIKENIPNLINSCLPVVIVVEGLGKYFEPLLPYQKQIKSKFQKISKFSINNEEFKYSIGIHIRLGDFISNYRTPIEWYVEKIHQINEVTKDKAEFLIFSDGTDEDLKIIMEIKNVKRSFCGNAFADIMALSYCALILGSDSTFSGWSAFLGQKPSIFFNKHYGRVMLDEKNEMILKQNEVLPLEVRKYLSSYFTLK